MAYFKSNEKDETRKNMPVQNDHEQITEDGEWAIYPDSGYGDGFDDLADEDGMEDMTEEDKENIRKNRARVLFGAGNLAGIISGTVLILLLVAFLFMMISFLQTDITRNFTLLQTKF